MPRGCRAAGARDHGPTAPGALPSRRAARPPSLACRALRSGPVDPGQSSQGLPHPGRRRLVLHPLPLCGQDPGSPAHLLPDPELPGASADQDPRAGPQGPAQQGLGRLPAREGRLLPPHARLVSCPGSCPRAGCRPCGGCALGGPCPPPPAAGPRGAPTRETYGPTRLDAACARALAFGDPAYRTIKTILERGLEGKEASSPIRTTLAGAFLRGPEELLATLSPEGGES